jgi:protein phosphatase
MNDQTVKIASAAVSDRGLSQKRPINEDSFLADSQRRIFAVADGVGGAQAGEVASQTAMEVLDEAFRYQEADVDVEDLMEIAIQRANASIYRMAKEHPKLQMMATTIVALHLDGHVATIGHVGDSRLYRLKPDGRLERETRDHSVVEEEVRAGRMTPAQAAHHPSRNVISRALGAEDTVEVDMKTIEVADGTSFLLCSDGITRHLPDDELNSLLDRDQSLEEICAEMKRLCYERGAEDNLTAVIIRVGDRSPASSRFDDERTIAAVRDSLPTTLSGDYQRADLDAALHETVSDATTPNGVKTTPKPVVVTTSDEPAGAYETSPRAAAPRPSKAGSFFKTLLLLLLLGAVGAGAYFAGMYKQRMDSQAQANANPAPSPTPTPVNAAAEFDRKKREVDFAPAKMASQMAAQNGGNPLAGTDPHSLYLYGRALLLSGKYRDAAAVFKRVSELTQSLPARDPLKTENRLAAAVAALKSGNALERERAGIALDEVIDPEGAAVPTAPPNSTASPSSPPPAGANEPVAAPVGLPR